MCGIAGHLGTADLPQPRVQACLDAMAHRGPDHRAVETFDLEGADDAPRRLTLLHTRLSIIDPDPRSNQPFRAGSTVLAFNGEVYNYKELRADLEDEGHAFETASDTEVLARALDAWGVDETLDRAEGMWAFAAFDAEEGVLRLARDRFGEKPLYLIEDDDGLWFASEVKHLRILRGRDPPVDEDHLKRYLAHGYRSLFKSDATFFEGVRRLAPATVLEVGPDDEAPREHGYWEPRFDPDPGMSYAEAVEGVRERLVRAVRLRMRADVPLAFCMSGGVDSNTLISVAARELGHDVHGFTVVDPDPRYDERDKVEAVVDELGIDHTAVHLEPGGADDLLADLRTMVRQHDAPVSTISYLVHWRLMHAVADAGYRVSISGTAADELFTGYWDHHLAYLAEARDDPERYEAYRKAWEEHVKPMVRNPLLRDQDLYVDDPGFRGHLYDGADRWRTFLREPLAEDFGEEDYADDLLRDRMLNELFHEVIPVILHEDDLNAMAHSIENRSPFLDRELFEFCMRIPTRHLMRDGYTKAVLRDAVKGVLPDAVRTERRKVGFNASLLSVLDLADDRVRKWLMSDGAIWDLVRRDKLEDLIDKATGPDGGLTNAESKFLFNLVCAKIFLDEFGGDGASRAAEAAEADRVAEGGAAS